MEFAHPYWFLLFLIFPFLYWYGRGKGELWARWPGLSELAPSNGTWRTKLQSVLPWLRFLALAALVFALARPQHSFTESSSGKGIDIVLALDVSPSMLSKDFNPDRLAKAKQVATDFVQKRSADRIALVSFGGEAITECPLTTDKNILSSYIARLRVGRLKDGTAIGMGLATALNRLTDKNVKSRIVILMTDGENNAGYIPPMQAAEIAEREGVKVYTIGIGSNGLVLSPIARNPDGSYEYSPRYTRIEEDLLIEIARKTKARYFRAFTEQDLEGIYEEINTLEKTDVEVKVTKYFQERFWPFAFAALFFICLELILRWAVLKVWE